MPATLPAPGIDVEVAIGAGSSHALARWDSGTFDFSSWSKADTSLGDWTDVTCDTLTPFSMGAGSGGDGVVTRWEAATCAFELVGDIYDPRSGAYAGLVGPGLPVRVRWRPASPPDVGPVNILTAEQSSFEGGTVGGWHGSFATLANTTAQASDGAHALAMTCTTPGMHADLLGVPVTPGVAYTGAAQVRALATRASMRVDLRWHDASGADLGGQAGTPLSDWPDRWTAISTTATAPPGASTCEIRVTPSSAAIGDVHYVDAVELVGPPTPAPWLVAFQGACDDEGFTYNPKTARAQVAATDGTRIFSAFDGVEQPEQGRNETAAQRVARIADMVGWPSTLRDIAPGGVTCQATTLAQPAWTQLLQVADTDLALLWINRAGQLAYRPQAKVTPSQEIAAIVGCDVPDVPDGVHVIDPVDMVGQQPTAIRNIVSISRQAPDDTGEAVTYTARDETSVSRFLAHAYQRTDLIHTDDAWSATVAQSVLMTSAWPASAPASVTLSSRADPAAPALLLALEPSLSVEVYDGAQTWQMEPAGWKVTVDRGEVSGTIDLVDVSMWYGSAWDSAGWDEGQWGF